METVSGVPVGFTTNMRPTCMFMVFMTFIAVDRCER